MQCFLFGKMMRSKMEKKNWLRFDSLETEEIDKMEKALRFKTPDEIITLNSIDPGTVNIFKPSTLLPTMGIRACR